MDAKEVIKKLQEKNYIIGTDAAKLILESPNPIEYYTFVLENMKDKFIVNLEDLKDFKKNPEKEEKPIVVYKTDFKPLAKEYDSETKVLKNIDRTDSLSFGEIGDFVDYFNSRYTKISDILKSRNTEGLTEIGRLRKKLNMTVKIIGIITEKKATKNGHIFMKLEDPTGIANALIPNSSKQLLKEGARLIEDEVVLFEGRLSKNLFIINKINEPDVPVREYKGIEEELMIGMISDTHVGSRLFMEKNFNKFIDWMNGKVGNEHQRKMAGRVKYITVAGDIADGIGVYPGQDKELSITDLYDQYAEVERLFLELPDYVDIIMCPGDHDAVKKADPQPMLPKKLMTQTYDMDNFTYISGPGMVELHGLKTLIYHGTSLVDFVAHYPDLNFENCAKSMVEMLKKRHIHPLYGGKPITPEKEDEMVIETLPDIFHTGESHNNSYDFYRGTVCVNSGAWQQITDYIIKLGQKATPAILPLVDMKRGKVSVMHFDKEEL